VKDRLLLVVGLQFATMSFQHIFLLEDKRMMLLC